MYLQEGESGSPMILLHGFPSSSEDWAGTIGPLARAHRVFAPDIVGFGRSALPDAAYSLEYFTQFIADFMAAVGLQRVVLVGHSMGGKLAIHCALHRPELVERLVLVSSDGFAPVPVWGRFSLGDRTIRRLMRLAVWEPVLRLSLRRVLYDPDAGSYAGDENYERLRHAMADPDHVRALVAISRNYRRFDLTLSGDLARLDRLRLPVLLIWGAQDKVFPPKVAARAAGLLPDARYVVLDRCGHLPMIEQPERFTSLVLDFLDDPHPERRGRASRLAAGVAR